MNVGEIRDRTEWERLKPVWNALLAESASATTFLTWEWLTAWWSAYGMRTTCGSLRHLTTAESPRHRPLAPGDGSSLRAADSRHSRLWATGRTIPITWTSSWRVVSKQRAVDAWLQHLRDDLAHGLILRLNEMPAARRTCARSSSSCRGG